MPESKSATKFQVTTEIERQYWVLKFRWPLPSKNDKHVIGNLTHEMRSIVMKAGGSKGQIEAVSRDFREAGFYIERTKK
jgi:hypothetical protein